MNSQLPFTFSPIPKSVELFKEVADAVQVYLEMLYTGDVALVDTVFHERAQLCTIENGDHNFALSQNIGMSLEGGHRLRQRERSGKNT